MSQLNGFFSLRTPFDLLEKLEADFKRLSDADKASKEAQYAAYDFFVCAEHIPDWLAGSTGGSNTTHRTYKHGPLVSHIANGAKHFRVTRPQHKSVKETSLQEGAFQSDSFQPSAFQLKQLVVKLEDGSFVDIMDIATSVIEHWRMTLARV